jgi:hypothetical protein
MAFLLVSSWLPAQRKHADPSDRSALPRAMARREHIISKKRKGGLLKEERKEARTLGPLVLLQVALAGHLGLLAVATAHGGWIRRRSTAGTRTSPGGRPAPLRVRFVVHRKERGNGRPDLSGGSVGHAESPNGSF